MNLIRNIIREEIANVEDWDGAEWGSVADGPEWEGFDNGRYISDDDDMEFRDFCNEMFWTGDFGEGMPDDVRKTLEGEFYDYEIMEAIDKYTQEPDFDWHDFDWNEVIHILRQNRK